MKKKIKQISKSKNRIIRVLKNLALIYGIFLTLKKFIVGKNSEKAAKA